jgi:hypothetical protein
MGQATNVLDAFDVEVFIFQSNLQIEVVKVIKPFLQFLKVYDQHQVHNMLVIMLDACFKSLHVVENYVGHGVVFVLFLSMMQMQQSLC